MGGIATRSCNGSQGAIPKVGVTVRVTEKPVVANGKKDTRHYVRIALRGIVFRALLDTGATCSLIGITLIKQSAKQLRPSESQIWEFDGGTSGVSGILPVTLEIDGC